MAIVMISSRYQGGREELSQALARKTNLPVLAREDLLERARKQGIKIGRLEVSMIKTPVLSDKLAREKALYLSFITAALCEQASQGDFIYHGRAGNFLLPGVSHRLRVGLTAPMAIRINRTARVLNLTPERAEKYLSQLDDDIERWIHSIHRADGRNPNEFDAFFNLENMSLSNAAAILCSMVELPDFQPTPASMKTLNDLSLSSHAKLRLAFDDRTSNTDLQVQADDGVVTVTYPPHQEQVNKYIPQVLADLDGCREIQCTMAETNILWVQERFEPGSDNFQQIIRLAQRWGAAVELLRLVPPGESKGEIPVLDDDFGRKEYTKVYDGGVEDDDPETATDDGGLGRTQEELVDLGRFGGRHTVCGGYDKVLESVQGNENYALVVIGNIFLSKGHSARTRQTRELALNVRDRLKAPLITADELKSRFLFGIRQAVTLLGFLALVVVIYGLVFTYQEPILNFLSGPLHQQIKWLAPVVMVVFIPFIAYIWGTAAELALKIINID
jgi:cytidylate kinase